MTGPESDGDVGTLYKGLGVLLFLAALIFTGAVFLLGREFDRFTVVAIALPYLGALILWRPKWLAWVIETVADKVPFVKFSKNAQP